MRQHLKDAPSQRVIGIPPRPLLLTTWIGMILFAAAVQAAAPREAGTLPPVRVKYRVSDAEWTEFPPRTPEMLPGFTHREYREPHLNRWGGWGGKRGQGPGFFRVKKEVDRWWLIDPDGGKFLHVGVAAIDPGKTPTAQNHLKETFGTPERWADQTTRSLRNLGFNGGGSWSRIDLLREAPKQRLVYTVIGNQGVPGGGNGGGFLSTFGKKLRVTKPGVGHTNYPNHCMPVFHPDFPAHCEEFARPLAVLKEG